MLNQCALVGKVNELPKEVADYNGFSRMILKLAVERPFPNVQNIVGVDVFEVELWRGASESTSALCKLGDVIGLRGRLEQARFPDKDGKEVWKCLVIAEKVSFIESRIINSRKNTGDYEKMN